MPAENQTLDLLRREIDAIDMAIHDLIVKRGTIVEDVRKIKDGAGPVLRPGREATVLRRLVEKHRGPFPVSALIAMWREMMAGFTWMQAPLSAAVYAPAGQDRLTTLARNHFGRLTPLSPLSGVSACVRAVVEGSADVGVVPMPMDGEAEPWWTILVSSDEKTPRVIARLPFTFDVAGEQALVIALCARDVSEDEASLLALHLSERASRGRILQSVGDAGFEAPVLVASSEIEAGRCFHLVEIASDIARDDARLSAFGVAFGPAFVEAQVIGGYARPLKLTRI